MIAKISTQFKNCLTLTGMGILIFSTFLLCFSSFASDKTNLIRELKKKAYSKFREKKYSEAIPYLERYLELQPAEIYMKLVYAQSLLLREDLPVPTRDMDTVTRIEKWREIRKNYKIAAGIFEENILLLENVRPREISLGKWYFQWATAEWFSGNKERAISLYKKAVKKDFTLIDSYYNIGAIYESLGQYSDAEKSWLEFVKAEKELKIED